MHLPLGVDRGTLVLLPSPNTLALQAGCPKTLASCSDLNTLDPGVAGTVMTKPVTGQFSRGSQDVFVYPRLPFLGELMQVRGAARRHGRLSASAVAAVAAAGLGTWPVSSCAVALLLL